MFSNGLGKSVRWQLNEQIKHIAYPKNGGYFDSPIQQVAEVHIPCLLIKCSGGKMNKIDRVAPSARPLRPLRGAMILKVTNLTTQPVISQRSKKRECPGIADKSILTLRKDNVRKSPSSQSPQTDVRRPRLGFPTHIPFLGQDTT